VKQVEVVVSVLALVLSSTSAACKGDSDKTASASEAVVQPRQVTVRVAMSAAFVSEAGVPIYRQITDYVGKHAGHRLELLNGLSYATINKMLASGDIDVGFVCGYPYVLSHDKPTPETDLLVAPVMKNPRYGGKPKYFSDLVVRKDGPFQRLEDLKGKVYVYNEEISNSGYNLPRFRFVEAGLPKGFFGQIKRSGSHEESIRMVANGEADASYVDSLVLEYDQAHQGKDATNVRVIDSVGPAGIPPVVVSHKVGAGVRQALARAFVTMHEDPEGRKILDAAFVEKFVAVDDGNYDDIRRMEQRAKQAGVSTIE
jgi:phosphate/phosphite/phosphonate ABC transporter binding protein